MSNEKITIDRTAMGADLNIEIPGSGFPLDFSPPVAGHPFYKKGNLNHTPDSSQLLRGIQ